jgi:hypothetical protein
MPNRPVEEMCQLILSCGGAAEARAKFRGVLNNNFVALSDGMVLSVNEDRSLNVVFTDRG